MIYLYIHINIEVVIKCEEIDLCRIQEYLYILFLTIISKCVDLENRELIKYSKLLKKILERLIKYI